MSRGTVKTHLSHIFTKLDTANRTELAAAAIDRGLPAGGRSPTG
jgi:DNA-binding NarL/FixJ family response regulator